MTDSDREAPHCLALVYENASRAEAQLAGAAVERAAAARHHARNARPCTVRPPLVARAGALRSADLAAALAAEGVPGATARVVAPHLERALDRDALAALDPGAWVSVCSFARDISGAERAVLMRFGRLVVEAAAALAAPRAVPSAVVQLEPLGRSAAGPWLGLLGAGAGLLGRAEPRALLAEVRDRLVDARAGVRAWLPDPHPAASTVAVRSDAGSITLAPFAVTERAVHAELEAEVLPDAALPAPVRRLPLGRRRR